MAEIKTKCPKCSKRYWVDSVEIGNQIECPRCQEVFTIAMIAPGDTPAATVRPSPTTIPLAVVPTNLPFNAPGETMLPEVGLAVVQIAPGSFLCGSDAGAADEAPAHRVELTYPFSIGKVPVTQQQYKTVMDAAPSHFKGARHPVESVTWGEAMEFCRRLTELESKATRIPANALFRLPTEAEWERACRGATGDSGAATEFCYGNEPAQLEEYAWFAANSEHATHPVGQKKPNALGIYEMHGNVGEWCLDWLGPYGADRATNPAGPATGVRRVRRGGGWASIPLLCRCANRLGVHPDCRSPLLGFRVVLVAEGVGPNGADHAAAQAGWDFSV